MQPTTEYNGFKLGDEVKWTSPNDDCYTDTGVICTINNECFFID